MQDLFYDHLLDREILIEVARSPGPRTTLHVVFSNDHFEFHSQEGGPPIRILDYEGNYGQAATFGDTADIKFFRFKNLMERSEYAPGSLRPPDGANLFSVVFSSEVLREVVKEFFQKYGLRLFMKPHERSFELVKQVDDLFVSYPYVLTSDTLRRIIFYTIAIVSNRHSVLVFEEPESNAFPYYTKYLGERIALDETNQFFIATHNPYLLSAVIEKGRKEDVQVFVTHFKDYQTKVKPLTGDEVSELMEADPFFSLDRFVEEKQ
jgi:hypothetical protein